MLYCELFENWMVVSDVLNNNLDLLIYIYMNSLPNDKHNVEINNCILLVYRETKNY